jgi:hypothetical protein
MGYTDIDSRSRIRAATFDVLSYTIMLFMLRVADFAKPRARAHFGTVCK